MIGNKYIFKRPISDDDELGEYFEEIQNVKRRFKGKSCDYKKIINHPIAKVLRKADTPKTWVVKFSYHEFLAHENELRVIPCSIKS